MLPVDDVSQFAYPCEVPTYNWYPELMCPQDWMKSGFSLVANRSRIIMDLTDIPVDDQEVCHDSIVKAIRRVKDEGDSLYTVALRFGEDI